MRRWLVASVAGLALIASQAAANGGAALGTDGRVGPTSAAASNLEGEGGGGLVFLIISVAIVAALIANAEAHEDDGPSSP